MKKSFKNKDITYTDTYRGYQINRSHKNDQGTYISSLDKIIDITEEYISNHNKIIVDREDVRIPQDSHIENTQQCMTRIIESFKREMERKTKNSPHNLDLSIIRTTEQSSDAIHSHAHLYILANGNVVENRYRFSESLKRHAKRIFDTDKDGIVHRCESVGDKGIMIRRDSPDKDEQLAKAIYAGSYLAKVKGKEDTPKGTNRLTISRTKK
ncbi:MAG: inovirus-type Gp2 protein [Lachnospiraceae bacterium]|nr:inovirus-type Gp2 protein [Lachnospiraceae bacterium]